MRSDARRKLTDYEAQIRSAAAHKYRESFLDDWEFPDCHKRRQYDAAVVAGDVVWLREEQPETHNPRLFSPNVASATPRPREESKDSEESGEPGSNASAARGR